MGCINRCGTDGTEGSHHMGQLSCIAFSSDGMQIVSGSFDNFVQVWDTTSSGVVLMELKNHTHWVLSVGFSSDGMRIQVVSGSYDNLNSCVALECINNN